MTESPSFAESARRAAARSPDNLAIVDGTTRWTWSEFDARIDAVAVQLAAAGVRSGSRVAVLASPSAGAIAVLHAIARVGAVAAPLGTGLTRPELATAATVIEPRLVVHGPGLEAVAASLGIPLLPLDDLIALRPNRDPAPDAPREPEAVAPRASPARPEAVNAPAAIVLTSGTTGVPKAVVLSMDALAASASAWLAALPPATGWLLTLGLAHVAGLGIVWRAAAGGVPLLVLDRPEAAEVLAALAGEPVPSHVPLVPLQLKRLLDAAVDAPPPSTLRAVLLGGGPIPPALVARAIEAGWPVVPTYGLSEAGSGVTANPTTEAARHPGSAGRPLPGVSIRIAGPDDTGVGVILVSTPACFSGYLGDPAATAAALTGDGWLRTGDLGRMDPDGRLTVLDRRTDRIVRGGENISPAEVEAVLLAHPAIAEAVVVARRDPAWGHLPVAAIVLCREVGDPGDDALALHCRAHLAGFKVPVAFFRVEALPRTASGKVRRVELRAILDPASDAATSNTTSNAPGDTPGDAPAGDAPAAEASALETSTGRHHIERPGGIQLGYQSVGHGPIPLLLLHGALSTAGQLGRLARALASSGALTVHAVDRRGSGRSRLADPAPVEVATHVEDLAAVLDAEGLPATILCGVSFGGVVALEFAARLPERSLAVVAWEPPYGPVADAAMQRSFARVAAATEAAHQSGGAASAAETFLRGVGGDAAWDRLSDRAKAFLADEGDGAYVDAGLLGLDPSRLGSIRVPTTLLIGDASEPFYRPIAEALAERIPGARVVRLPELAHASSITDPVPVADAVMAALLGAGVIGPRVAAPQVAASRLREQGPAERPTQESDE